MDYFNYKNGELYCEDVPVAAIAEKVGTPAYVYSKATLVHHYRQIAEAFGPVKATVCYSVKSCANIHICKLLVEQGCGMDVTSGGELYRALEAGTDPKKIIYAGVGKTDVEIVDAINAGIAAFNIESEAEIENIDRLAGQIGKTAVGALRINPDYAEAHVNLGNALSQIPGRQSEAIAEYQAAVRIRPDYANLVREPIRALRASQPPAEK